MGEKHFAVKETSLKLKPVINIKPKQSQALKHPILQLQQIIGNQALARMIQRQADQPATPVGNLNIINTAQSRAAGDIGTAYDWSPGWWYSPNSGLAGWRSRPLSWETAQNPPPAGEGIVNWGDNQPTCNIFVYDVLFAAGYNPPLRSNRHYYDARETYNQNGDLATYFNLVADLNQVVPGDIMTTGGHMEIVSSSIRSNSFNAIGAHWNGAYETSKTYNNSLRFYRLSGT